MEIEKTLTVAAPPAQVWQMLLDPTVMAAAVPGMQSIEVHSPTEYSAVIAQKIAFISAKFKLNTRIVEQRPPEYLRAEGTGEDASVASSLKQTSEVFLSPSPDGGTALRIKVNVELLGRLGSFGLAAMKTKADRLWEEFGANLARSIESGQAALPAAASVASAASANSLDSAPGFAAAPVSVPAPAPAATNTHGLNSLDGLPPPVLPQPAASGAKAQQAPTPASAQAVAPPMAAAVTPGAATQAASAPVPIPVSTPAAPALAASAAPAVSTVQEVSSPGLWGRLFGKGRSQTIVHGGSAVIRVELRQREQTLHVEWPAEQAQECHAWLSTVLAQDSKA